MSIEDDDNGGGIVLEFKALDGSKQAAIFTPGPQPKVEIVPVLEDEPSLTQPHNNRTLN